MFERHQTKIAVFGGKSGEKMQYKGTIDLMFILLSHCVLKSLLSLSTGMAGNQVLEWSDLDTEIKTAGVKSVCCSHLPPVVCTQHIHHFQDPLAPPDL